MAQTFFNFIRKLEFFWSVYEIQTFEHGMEALTIARLFRFQLHEESFESTSKQSLHLKLQQFYDISGVVISFYHFFLHNLRKV